MADRITSARIEPAQGFGSKAKVLVKLGEESPEALLFDYFDDELHFAPHEFVGKTEEEGHALFFKKDLAYLRS